MPRPALLLPLRRIAWLLMLFMLVPSLARGQDAKPTPEQIQFFESKVRPVLVENCVKCHGPDKQKGHLRLDSRAGALAGGDLGPAIVPGKPDESLLVSAIGHGDDQLKMPPSKKLPAQPLADLKRWVEIGAPWPGNQEPAGGASASSIRRGPFTITEADRAHWSFRPVKRPTIPQVEDRDKAWVRNPIDAFILQGLATKGLRPNPPASRHELVRRAYYDLTGLPPTPSEADAFVNDSSPSAYESLIDRLLASPHYGEKWGRHWLDLVRFAETNSYERDNPKPSAWRYRDYVIRSLNQDKPYDQFVREQLAGDEIRPGDIEALTATGYYRLGIWDDEPTDRDLAHYDSLDDIVATTGQVFLGMTVDCARCHDHKLDPIPQKDYYRLLAFFQNINDFHNGGPTDEFPIFTDPSDKEAHERRVRELEQKRNDLRSQIASIEEEFLAKDPAGRSEGARRADLEELHYRYFRDTWRQLPDFDVIRHEESGMIPSGFFDLAVRTRDISFGIVFEGLLVVPEDGTYTFSLDSDDGARLRIDDKVVLEYDGVHEMGKARSATIELSRGRVPIRLDYFQAVGGHGLSVSWSGPGVPSRSLSASPHGPRPEGVPQLLRTRGEQVLGAERFASYKTLQRELARLARAKPAGDTVLRVTERGSVCPETHVLLRGNPHVPGDKVEPGFLQVLTSAQPRIPTPAPGATSSGRRIALADWIASSQNPLTPRVIANRLWQHHFGRGIVRSPNNLGTQGDKPTHPELLDWLASELVEAGWRLKVVHKRIMMSNVYQMASRSNPEGLAKDPANDLFWRFDMRRLTGEELRDSILAVSGSLNPKMYGPGVYPKIPREVMAGQSVPGSGWGRSSPQEQARRSIYVHVKRSLLLPILESYDLAETDRSTPARFSTTQPTQALAMLNSEFLNEQAKVLADRLQHEAGDDPSAQVRLGFWLVTARTPSEAEVRRGVNLIAVMDAANPGQDHAGLRAFSLVALNLNEFLFLD
jgi:hypothetical protein